MRRSGITVIYGHNTPSMLWGNSVLYEIISGEELLRYSNVIKSVGIKNVRIIIA